MERIVSAVPRGIDHIIAIDTEDDTKGNLRIACVYGSYLRRGHRKKEVVNVEETFYSRQELSKFLRELKTKKQDFNPCTIIGFNVDYDMAYFEEVVDYTTVLYSGTRFIMGSLKNGIPIIDIFNHGGGRSLDTWITELKLNEKGIFKTEWRPDMSLAELISHCQNDVKAHWEVAEFFRKTYADIGFAFKTTTSAAALNLFKRKFLLDRWVRESDLYNADERQAYYGGRTECFSRGKQSVKSYDINSAYVSVMESEWYPKPDTAKRYKTGNAFRYFYKDREKLMIVNCTVYAPKSRVMVLPYRDPETKKLIFPCGTFTGWWCSPELHKAEEYGYKILKVHKFIIYHTKMKYFEQYARYTWNNRLAAERAGNNGMKVVWKLFGNGLYGKMAQLNPVGGGFSTAPQTVREGDMPLCYVALNGDKWYVNASTEKEESLNSFPCVSAFITCYTRLKLLDYLKRHENDVVYCDTDSIKIPWNGKQEVSSKDLGGVKYEEENSGDYIFLKPKLYGKTPASMIDIPESYDYLKPTDNLEWMVLEMLPGDQKWKIKGVTKYSWAYFDLVALKFRTEYKKPHRFKESIRRQLTRNEWETHQKELSLTDDKRHWLGKDSEPLELGKTILTQQCNI